MTFNESDHVRQPKGSPDGGMFAAQPAGAEAALGLAGNIPSKRDLPPMTAVSWYGSLSTGPDVHPIYLDQTYLEDDEWDNDDLLYALESSARLRIAGMHDLADAIDERVRESGVLVNDVDRATAARKIGDKPPAIVVTEDESVVRTSPNVLVYDTATLDKHPENADDLIVLAEEAAALLSFGKAQEADLWSDHIETEVDRVLGDHTISVTGEQLEALANFKGQRNLPDLPRVRMAVAEHPKVCPDTAWRLIEDRDWRVRSCVAEAAKHGAFGLTGLRVLSADPQFDVSTHANMVWDELSSTGLVPRRQQ